MHPIRPSILFLSFALACSTIIAEEFPLLSDAQSILAAAADVVTDRYPDADTVYLFSAERVRYEPDGTSVSYSESWIKVLTEKGRRERSVFSFGFNEAYGTVEVPLAEIHRADGTVSAIDVASLSRVMIAPDQMHKNIFDPRQKVLRLGIPGIEIGDTIRVHSIRRQTKTRMPDTWADFTVFEAPVPLLHAVYEVEAPGDRPLFHRLLKGEVPGTVTYEETVLADGGTRHRWVARDVPRLFEEPAMPDWWTVAQRLLVSTIHDWETVSRWYWNLSLPRLESTTPAMEAMVRELSEGREDRQSRIESIFLFVSQQIRYMGITTEDEAPGYEPHDVHITFENRYGVCRDKAALLVAMLRMAGFEAFPVLIHVGPRKDAEVPQPFFNHAIVAVREPDGSYQLMDMTDETTRELLPAYLGDRSYLVATPEGETLLTSPVVPASENMARITTEAALAPSGLLTGTTHIRLEGINDNAYRGYFASIKPAERRRFFEGLIKRVLPGATMTRFDLRPADMQDTSMPIEITLGFSVPDYPVAGGDAMLLPPPWFGTSVGMVNFILRQTGLQERRFPLRTGYACGVEERFTLALPDPVAGTGFRLPVYEPMQDHTLSWKQSLRMEDGSLAGESVFLLHVSEFDPQEYLALKAMLGDLEFNRRRWPVRTPDEAGPTPQAEDEADVAYAFRTTEIEWESDTAWTEVFRLRKTVLTYAGIKDHSEIMVHFNPAWEDVELVEARVTAPDGTTAEARSEEINVMDAAWVASAPRYPAARTLVVNLPGVRVGSTIDVTIRRKRRDRLFFDFRESFGGIEPVGRVDVVLAAPQDRAPSVRVVGGPVAFAEEANGREGWLRHTWSSESPHVARREEDLPPDWSLFPTLFLSSGSWGEYADRVGSRLKAAAAESDDSRSAAQALLTGLDNPDARIRVIRDFVARRIRSAGPDFTQLPLDALSPADRTFQDGYGHAADQAILLYAMLEAAGLEPAFVLASRWPADPGIATPLRETPQRDLFTTVLVRVQGADGPVYLNDTDQYAELGATPNEGVLYLEAPSGLDGTIRASENQPRRTHAEYAIRIDTDGAAQIDVVRRFEGVAHAAARRRFEEMTPEDRRRYHQEAVSAVSQRARPADGLTTDFSHYPGEERFSVTIDRFAVREGNHLYLHLPGSAGSLPIRADQRSNPIWWSQRSTERVLYHVVPPEGARRVLSPPEQVWAAPGRAFSLRRQASVCPDLPSAWVQETLIERVPGLIEPTAYPELLDAHRRFGHPRNRLLLFELSE